jgi:hypothetical protein
MTCTNRLRKTAFSRQRLYLNGIMACMLATMVTAMMTGVARAADTETASMPLYASAEKKSPAKGEKPAKKKGDKTSATKKSAGSKSKLRVGAMGQIVTGPQDAPKPGIFGFGGSAGYRLSPTLEAEAGLSYFAYGLNYADFETLVDISDVAINADAILLMPVSSTIKLRGRGGAGMHNTKVTVSGQFASEAGAGSESVTSLAINLGGGLELNFGSFYLAGEIRKPILLSQTKSMGGNLMQLTGEAGIRF